jgi:hypothetical protein
MKSEGNQSMEPPPTYAIPIVCLIVACLLAALECYQILAKASLEVVSLFLAPAAFLLGIIGLFDPRVPGSLQPNASGYPRRARLIANGCWVVGAVIGLFLYFLLRS